jgi:hypothetical protein
MPRGVTDIDAQIERFFELVSTKSEKLWHEDITFRLVWRSEYDKMVSHYVERIAEVVDKWMATAAGEWFVEKRKVDQKGHATSILPKSIFASVFILFRPPLPPYEPRFQDQMNDPKETDGGLARTNSAPPSTGFPTFNSGNNANSIGGDSIK